MDQTEAKGPAYARAFQPLLISDGARMEDFCMQIDAHTIFSRNWDDEIIKQWADTDNEYAILTTYPTNAMDITPDGGITNSNNHWEVPHMCDVDLVGGGIANNAQASAAANLQRPCLSKLWAAGLSFGRCHAERDVPADPNLKDVFTGEEFGRGVRLWTNGYDMYTLARPVIGTWYGDQKGGEGNWRVADGEAEQGRNRLRMLLSTNATERSAKDNHALRGYDIGTRRRLEDYFALTGIDTIRNTQHKTPCAVKKWHPWQPHAQGPYMILSDSPVLAGTRVQPLDIPDTGRKMLRGSARQDLEHD
jgi:hypothetical protein